ncbi:MAG TPA: hypothetical protein VHD87_11005 [Acidimicrobiales bacterium]|nr:hypothetical protein [Acidimicrobiales bacterium]
MTIKPGQPWGEPATGDDGAAAVEVHTDRDISRALDRRESTTFRITAGDLFRTVGAAGMAFPIDVGEVLVDGRLHHFVAHLLMRERGWRRFVVVMNAPWMGEWNFGPKAHPNDGVLDVSEADLGRFEWRKVKARLPTGSHLPHPRIKTHRTKAMTFEFPRGAEVTVDGESLGTARHVAIRVVPDAITVIS